MGPNPEQINPTMVAKLVLLALVVMCGAESPVEKAASEAVSKLDSMGADTVQRRAVVGGVAGVVAGLLAKKAADTIVTCGVLGGILVGGACYIGWIKPEQVK